MQSQATTEKAQVNRKESKEQMKQKKYIIVQTIANEFDKVQFDVKKSNFVRLFFTSLFYCVSKFIGMKQFHIFFKIKHSFCSRHFIASAFFFAVTYKTEIQLKCTRSTQINGPWICETRKRWINSIDKETKWNETRANVRTKAYFYCSGEKVSTLVAVFRQFLLNHRQIEKTRSNWNSLRFLFLLRSSLRNGKSHFFDERNMHKWKMLILLCFWCLTFCTISQRPRWKEQKCLRENRKQSWFRINQSHLCTPSHRQTFQIDNFNSTFVTSSYSLF